MKAKLIHIASEPDLEPAIIAMLVTMFVLAIVVMGVLLVQFS